jgi:hypothetical protein
MDDGLNGEFSLIYNGAGDPHTVKYLAQGLKTGLPYRFKVKALNINGAGPESNTVTIYACLKPSGLLPPKRLSTTATSITIIWTEPNAEGCPITGFNIFRDSGNSDALSVDVDASAVHNKPSLRQYEVGKVAALTNKGKVYRFKIRAYNNAYWTDSEPLLAVLASVPDTPTSAPVSNASITNESRIQINYGPQPASENGGSPITSYELQVDNAKGGDFKNLIGGDSTGASLETTYLYEVGIKSGDIYRFRYRSKNVNGWSSFSTITYIRAATVPERPAKPIFNTATATSITLDFN